MRFCCKISLASIDLNIHDALFGKESGFVIRTVAHHVQIDQTPFRLAFADIPTFIALWPVWNLPRQAVF